MNAGVNPGAVSRTLVLGGTRSGKSRYAEELLGDAPGVRYLATARRVPGDAEWDARVAAHVARRPGSWTTEEIGAGPDLAAALATGGPVLVDDLATWLTGILDDAGAWDAPGGSLPEVDAVVGGLVAAVRDAPGPLVLVSAETGLGVVPESRSGRLFRDRLGELNAALAAVCEETVLVVAGRPLRLPPGPAPATGSATQPTAAAPVTPVSMPRPVSDDVATPTGEVAGTPAAVPASGDGGPSPAPADGRPPATDDNDNDNDNRITVTAVGRPDTASRRAAVARVSTLAMPVAGLGRLGELGVWLASCQGECPPRPPVRSRVVLLAADHGIAEAGVSAYPQAVSAIRASAAAAGRLPVTVAAGTAGATVRVVDVGLAEDGFGDDEHVVVRGTGRVDRTDALTPDQAASAWRTGRRLADEEIESGADVLVPGTLGVGASTPAATLVAALTGAEPVAVVGRASGIDDRAWMRKAVAIRDGLRRARPHLRDPLGLLGAVGGTDLTVLAGFLARAARRKVPCVLDGVAVGAAALLAEELAPGAKEYWLAAQPSTEPAAALVLEHLSLTPVLDLAVRTDDGTAGVTVLPLLVTAARLLGETGTAEDTGIVPGAAPARATAAR
ncbi:bifunctional adenosylcobinamide kinase/adenosylcobinamide-phosphate guanylyltransferase [Pseudonocardia nantongensis]|uniref:bifunctional adenosylcobinamide kinase/adenosylcobinamide-phosphate guanylyltransferase n=1 Tax=Pseudonocardia nantongensis TaxID=1181885 RepID=UPI00397CF95B